MSTDNFKKFQNLVSSEVSPVHEKMNWRKSNEDWLDKSSAIAIKILHTLRTQQLSQKELAEKLGVSAQHINKIVKGKENLSLDTISKLEIALGIQLIEVETFSSSAEYNMPTPDKYISIEQILQNSYLNREAAHLESLPVGETTFASAA